MREQAVFALSQLRDGTDWLLNVLRSKRDPEMVRRACSGLASRTTLGRSRRSRSCCPPIELETTRPGATAVRPVESNDGPNRVASDATLPPPGGVLFYVNRARNACPSGLGSLGTTSAGAERVGVTCP